MSRSISYLLIALAALCGGIFIGSYFRMSTSEISAKAESSSFTDSELAQRLRKEKVEAFYKWDVGDTPNFIAALIQLKSHSRLC